MGSFFIAKDAFPIMENNNFGGNEHDYICSIDNRGASDCCCSGPGWHRTTGYLWRPDCMRNYHRVDRQVI